MSYILILLSLLHLFLSNAESVVVKVEQGKLRGERLRVVTGDAAYFSFKGIPYARPPIGDLRFKAPLPPQPWDGVRNATKHGPICWQKNIITGEIVPSDEDCLYLNVYTPDLNPVFPLAVIVFIPGGAYTSGSGNDDYYGPDFLIKHNVVLVTINYRLGAFGFLCLDSKEVPGNAGMKDQVYALRWVRQNINKFGGDPNNVTIFGHSAGGASVSMHIVSPMSKGLFNRAISMSGVGTCDWAVPFESRRKGFALGKQLGLDTENENELLEFLQKIPAEKIVDTKVYILASEKQTTNLFKSYPFAPVAEKNFGQERFLYQNLLQTLHENKVDVEVMIGYTNEECIFEIPWLRNDLIEVYDKYIENFAPNKIMFETSSSKTLKVCDLIKKHYFGNKHVNKDAIKEFTRYVTEKTFIYKINEFARSLSKNTNNNVYFYQFSCSSERNVYGNFGAEYGIKGAAHMDDMMYLFNSNKLGIPIVKDSLSYKMIHQACLLVTNFAKYGNPTPEPIDCVTWPVYDHVNQKYLNIGQKLIPGKFPNPKADKFWNKVYKVAGVDM